MTKPVVDGICQECGREYTTLDPLDYVEDSWKDCPVDYQSPAWCPSDDCPSNSREQIIAFLYEVWQSRKESDPGILIHEVSPYAVASLLLEVWDKGYFRSYLEHELSEIEEREEEAAEEAREKLPFWGFLLDDKCYCCDCLADDLLKEASVIRQGDPGYGEGSVCDICNTELHLIH